MKTMSMTYPKQGFVQFVLRCFSVGIVYALANSLVAFLLGPLSRQSATLENAAVWTLTGALTCLAFSPFILHARWSRANTTLAVWAAIVFVRCLGLGIEGALFKPASMAISVLGAVSGSLVALPVAWLCVFLLQPADGVVQVEPAERPSKYASLRGPRWWSWAWRILLLGLAYFVFYFVFGATNALLYTKSFYENNPQYGLTLPPYAVIFAAQLLRGPLFGLGSLFIARSADLPRRQLGLWLGLLLFVIGGLAPYVEVTFRSMPLGFNLATLTEILFQNVLTGVVAAGLFGPRPASR